MTDRMGEIRNVLDGIEYKEGWSFRATGRYPADPYGPRLQDFPMLTVTYRVQDPTQPRGADGKLPMRDNVFRISIPPLTEDVFPRTADHMQNLGNAEDRIRDWVFSVITWLEIHEAAEFFRYKGEATYEPHRDAQERANMLAQQTLPGWHGLWRLI